MGKRSYIQNLNWLFQQDLSCLYKFFHVFSGSIIGSNGSFQVILLRIMDGYFKLICYKLIKGVIWTSKQQGAGIHQFEGRNWSEIGDFQRLFQGDIQLCLEQLQEHLQVDGVAY